MALLRIEQCQTICKALNGVVRDQLLSKETLLSGNDAVTQASEDLKEASKEEDQKYVS